MAEPSSSTFANRDEPVPMLTSGVSDSDTSSASRRLRKSLSRTTLKNKVKERRDAHTQKIDGAAGRPSLQDRFFSKLLHQIVPNDEYEDDDRLGAVDYRSSDYVKRPPFSVTTMTNNFRRFNARIGIVFVFQNRLIRLFSWRTTSHTLSFLVLYSFVCLDPYLLVVLPGAVALLFIMVPAFRARHPEPPPSQTFLARADHHSGYDYAGPPIAPATIIRPAAETSKDFFRNMRDLQNSMADFSNIHDLLISRVAPVTNFSDEILSSTIFLYLFMATCLLFVSAHLLPIRFVALVGGNLALIANHPTAAAWLSKQQKRASVQVSELSKTLSAVPDARLTVPGLGISLPSNVTTRSLQQVLSSASAITLATAPPTAEVEIFELQHRPLLPPGTNFSYYASILGDQRKPRTTVLEWQPYVFTPTPYDPLSPQRVSASRPQGTRFFEDVRPPDGWEWHSPKWELDLEAGEWVNDRLIVGVEYDILHQNNDDLDGIDRGRKESVHADFGGWVWDLPPPENTASGLGRDEEVWLAYGDYDLDHDKERSKKRPGKSIASSNTHNKDWEESTKFGQRGRTGEWRRRRWVRVVRRKVVQEIQ